jgi:hypothetical protein
MTALPARHQKFQAVKNGLMTFIEATKPKPRRKPHLWLVPPPAEALPVHEETHIDPVELTVMAVNRLGIATFRTATSGKVSTVAVPDARTAEIFRAALLEMQKVRRTDRLVDVVVSGGDGPANPNPAGPNLKGRGSDAVKA